MTKQDRKKLAKAARELAMECVAGTAPEMATHTMWRNGAPGCALGQLAARCGAKNTDDANLFYDAFPFPERVHVTIANDFDSDALPWALLSLADELESAP